MYLFFYLLFLILLLVIFFIIFNFLFILTIKYVLSKYDIIYKHNNILCIQYNVFFIEG